MKERHYRGTEPFGLPLIDYIYYAIIVKVNARFYLPRRLLVRNRPPRKFTCIISQSVTHQSPKYLVSVAKQSCCC